MHRANTLRAGLAIVAFLNAAPLSAAPPGTSQGQARASAASSPAASSGSHSASSPRSYGADIEPIFLKHCHSCHSTETPKADLILDRGTGFRAMVERASIQVPEARIVAPGNVEASYLWAKLQGSTSIGKGMPRTLFSAKKLPPKDLELVREWIASGAHP